MPAPAGTWSVLSNKGWSHGVRKLFAENPVPLGVVIQGDSTMVNQRVVASHPTRLMTIASIQAFRLSTTATTLPLRPQHDRKSHPPSRFSVTRPSPIVPSRPVTAMKQPPQILMSSLVQPSASLQTAPRSLRACLVRETCSSLRNRQSVIFD